MPYMFGVWAHLPHVCALCTYILPGYTGQPCATCSAGTYKVEMGDQACTVCPAFSSSAEASMARTDCICQKGATGPNG